MQEFHLENVLARYPDLIEPGLTLTNRQGTIRNKRIDLLFCDSIGRTLVVEVKIGKLGRTDIGQLIEYCHYVFERDGVRPRGMLVGTHVTNEIRGAAGFSGFECMCLPLSHLEQAMVERGDHEMLEAIRSWRSSNAAAVGSTAFSQAPGHGLGSVNLRPAPTVIATSASEPASPFAKRNKAELSVADMLRSVLSAISLRSTLSAHEITSMVLDAYPCISKGSILPADRCYNITNAGLDQDYDFRIFQYLGRSTYRYLGENYPYSGYVTWKDERCGLWTKGVLAKWENWPVRRKAK